MSQGPDNRRPPDTHPAPPVAPHLGWTCPNCGSGLAPHVDRCPCTVAYPGRFTPYARRPFPVYALTCSSDHPLGQGRLGAGRLS